MPDHLHGILYVRHTMDTSIRSIVRGFWQGCKKAGRIYSSSLAPEFNSGTNKEAEDDLYLSYDPIFTAQPHIQPMGYRNQLPATIRYLDMNPRRLATKRLKPGYFCVQRDIQIAGRTYSGVGNIMLLDSDRFMPVHVRQMMVEGAKMGNDQPLRDYMNRCVLTARQGAVMVSPFISPHEKQVMNILLAEGLPFIILTDNGFRDYYKPSDGLFDAVAKGQVLILSPWEYDADKKHITYNECHVLNAMAEEICEGEEAIEK